MSDEFVTFFYYSLFIYEIEPRNRYAICRCGRNDKDIRKKHQFVCCLFFLYHIHVNMPIILRTNPHTGTVAVVKKPLTFRVKKPLTLKVKKPQLKNIVFPPQSPRTSYIRKKPYQELEPWRKKVLRSVPPQFSSTFASKQIHYVAAIVCHGISCDQAQHLVCQGSSALCENPLFKTEYDMVFTSKYGDTSAVYGNSHLAGNYLCEKMKNRKNGSGADFMEILDSTIDRRDTTNAKGIGGALGKDTILIQKDIGDNVADLELFMDGTHSQYINDNDNDNDCIFLFKFDPINDCDNVKDHNALAVNPRELIERKKGLGYVAQAAQNLQSFIEPTNPTIQTKDNGTYWSDVTHQLKEFRDNPDPYKRIVRLSDILKKKGIFPEGTVVVTYVCRSTLVHNLCVNTPTPDDYTPAYHATHATHATPRLSFGSFVPYPNDFGGAAAATSAEMSPANESMDQVGTPSGTPGTPGSHMTGSSWFDFGRPSWFITPSGTPRTPGTPFDPDDPSWMSKGGAMKKRKNKKSLKTRRSINVVNVSRRTRSRSRSRSRF